MIHDEHVPELKWITKKSKLKTTNQQNIKAQWRTNGLEFVVLLTVSSTSCPVCMWASSIDGAETGCLSFSSRTLAGSLERTSRARAGQPALKWPCAVWKYKRRSSRVIPSSASCWSRASVPPYKRVHRYRNKKKKQKVKGTLGIPRIKKPFLYWQHKRNQKLVIIT